MINSENELGCWKVEGKPLVIEYSRAMLETLRKEVIEGLHKIPRGGLEIGGVLFGKRSGHTIRILASRPLPCEHAAGPSFVLSEKDEVALKQLAESAGTDGDMAGMAAVGWYHSHTRSGISLSSEDIGVWDRHFPEPWQVALVLHPQKLKPTRAGYFIREGNGRLRTDSSYLEFDLEPMPQRQETLRTAPTPQKRPETAVTEPETRRDPAPLRKASRVPWLLFALAWCVAALSSAFAFRDYWMPKNSEKAEQLPAPDPVREQMAAEIQKLRTELVQQIQRNQDLEAEISAIEKEPAKKRTAR